MEKLLSDKMLLGKMAESSHLMAEELFDVRKVNGVICHAMGM